MERLIGGDGDGGGVSDLRAAARFGEPSVEGVAFAGSGGKRAVGGTVGDGFCRRAGRIAAIGIEGDAVGIRRPTGEEGVVVGNGDDGGGGDFRAAARFGEPTVEGVAFTCGGGEAAVGGIVGDLFAGQAGCAATIGIKGDGVGVDRPFGIESQGGVVGVVGTLGIGCPGTITGGVPAIEGVAEPG